MAKKLSYVLILAGLLVMLFPYAREWYYDWRQERLLGEMESQLFQAEEPPEAEAAKEAAYRELSRLMAQESSGGAAAGEAPDEAVPGPASPSPGEESAQPTAEPKPTPTPNPAIAILTIDKINLKLPVLEGATQENMKLAAGHMVETTPLGETGNAAIAAHRALTKGRLFNRLDEVEEGDRIVIDQKGKRTEYIVFRTFLVEPEDVSVLKGSKTEKILTLITCDPVVNATHRLIVQAKEA
ncbi:class D sortase [Paenibacillus sp. YN15]|uniref:class D sortase n=1 Tax=Paenibacillus sp. YN15 TaxID=1742774 RepID=UPI00215BCE46|nr:class D sortase [Paenibacillus sp. YN15]